MERDTQPLRAGDPQHLAPEALQADLTPHEYLGITLLAVIFLSEGKLSQGGLLLPESIPDFFALSFCSLPSKAQDFQTDFRGSLGHQSLSPTESQEDTVVVGPMAGSPPGYVFDHTVGTKPGTQYWLTLTWLVICQGLPPCYLYFFWPC